LLTGADYEFALSDSRARAVVVSAPLAPMIVALKGRLPFLEHVIVSGARIDGTTNFADWIAGQSAQAPVAPTTPDDVCFWLYSSGSTGTPKGAVHLHADLVNTAELYARPVLGLRDDDIVFSAAKLFFAYGLGNALTFPMAVGATAVLMAERPTPASIFRQLIAHRPTIFFGVPTLYAAMLASPDFPPREALALRCCVSAGKRSRQNWAGAGASVPASISSMDLGRPKCCTSSCRIARVRSDMVRPASPSPGTHCA
jgi:benzoate-CoA ligase